MDRRSFLALMGVVAVAPEEMLTRVVADPQAREVPAGYQSILGTALMIQWGTAGEDGLVVPHVDTQILTVCSRVKGDKEPTLLQLTAAGFVAKPGADWLVLGISRTAAPAA